MKFKILSITTLVLIIAGLLYKEPLSILAGLWLFVLSLEGTFD